jgi:hypothetical protein
MTAVWLALIVAFSGAFTAYLNYKMNARTVGKVEQVHELVNSGATKQITDTYDATKAQLVTLDQLLALQTATGKTVSRDATVTREALSKKVVKLEAELAERAKQTEIAASKLV